MRQRKFLFAIMALLLMFAACKGESPTSPTTGVTPSTPTVPPSGASVTLTVSNASPLVNSTSIITATVTQNGSPVPNGTAVQFTTSVGSFTDTGSSGATVIKTTTNGVATATLTSGSAGAAVVTATVNNVSKTTTITFSATTVPTTPSTAPTLTSVTPTTGRPEGGETIVITGTNFRAPVRVIFTCVGSAATPSDPAACNGQGPKDALVTNVTPTQITAITPSFNVSTGQAVSYTITVLVGAGTTTEASVSATNGFTFTSTVLTPKVNVVTPASGPITGGTRVTIQGSGFQAPVQVFFGAAEVQVISTTFSQIIAMSPAARDTSPDGSTPVTGIVPVRVRNVNSGTEIIFSDPGFRYTPALRITTVDPVIVSALTGQFHIDGIGFDGPVTVVVNGTTCDPDNKPFGFGLVVLRVSGTELFVRLPPDLSPCFCAQNVNITVTNVNTGESATSPQQFAIAPSAPTIVGTSIPSGGVTPGSSITVSVLNPGIGDARFNIGNTTVTPSPNNTTTATGTTNFNVVIPDATAFTFPTQACVTAAGTVGSQLGAVSVPVFFSNITTGCFASLSPNVTVLPPAPNTCAAPTASVTSPAAACPNLPAVSSAGTTTQNVTITIANAAGSPNLVLGAPTISNQVNATSTVIAPSTGQTVPGGAVVNYTFQLDPAAPGATGSTVTFTTNDPARPVITVNLCGNAT